MNKRNGLGTVLVFGATGAQGAPVVRQALSAGARVRAAARDAAKVRQLHGERVEAVAADAGEPAALEAAFDATDAVFYHLPLVPDPALRARYLKNVLRAAKGARVRRFVFSTSGMAKETMAAAFVAGNREAARTVLESRLPAVVLQPTLYLENLLWPHLAAAMIERGVLDYPPLRPDRRLSWTALDDQAAVAVAVMTAPGVEGRAIEVVSPESVTGPELAAKIAARLGRTMRYQPLTPAQFGQGLAAAFGSEALGQAIAGLFESIDALPGGETVIEMDPVLAALPLRLTSVSEWVGRQQWNAAGGAAA